MNVEPTSQYRPASPSDRRFPADGPVEAVLGYAVFYVLVDRTTPAFVEVFSERVLDLSPALVRLGLASFLWFVLVLTALDQGQRQLAALGIGSQDAVRPSLWSRVVPTTTRALGYAVGVLVGFPVAAWTFEPAVETLTSMIVVIPALDVQAFVLGDFLVMALFFVAWGVAAHSLDRLLVGGVRAAVSD